MRKSLISHWGIFIMFLLIKNSIFANWIRLNEYTLTYLFILWIIEAYTLIWPSMFYQFIIQALFNRYHEYITKIKNMRYKKQKKQVHLPHFWTFTSNLIPMVHFKQYVMTNETNLNFPHLDSNSVWSLYHISRTQSLSI